MRYIIAFLLITSLTLHAEDWTVQGTYYQNIVVLEHDALSVTIASGGTEYKFQLQDLSPSLQQKFGYSPVRASAAKKEASNHHSMDEIGGI